MTVQRTSSSPAGQQVIDATFEEVKAAPARRKRAAPKKPSAPGTAVVVTEPKLQSQPAVEASGSLLAKMRTTFDASYRAGVLERTGKEPESSPLAIFDPANLGGAGTALVTASGAAQTALAAAATTIPEMAGTATRFYQGTADGSDVAKTLARTESWNGFVGKRARKVLVNGALKRVGKVDAEIFSILNVHAHSTTDKLTALRQIQPHLRDFKVTADVAFEVLKKFRDTDGKYDPAIVGDALSSLASNIDPQQGLLLIDKFASLAPAIKLDLIKTMLGEWTSVDAQQAIAIADHGRLTGKQVLKLLGRKLSNDDAAIVTAHFAPPPRTRETAIPTVVADVAPQVASTVSALAGSVGKGLFGFAKGLKAGMSERKGE